jgi:hypothetical protein
MRLDADLGKITPLWRGPGVRTGSEEVTTTDMNHCCDLKVRWYRTKGTIEIGVVQDLDAGRILRRQKALIEPGNTVALDERREPGYMYLRISFPRLKIAE